MIDLENEMVQKLIEETKRKIEREILKCFKVQINSLFLGELQNGVYTININFESIPNEHKIPVGHFLTTNIEITEEDYKKWTTRITWECVKCGWSCFSNEGDPKPSGCVACYGELIKKEVEKKE